MARIGLTLTGWLINAMAVVSPMQAGRMAFGLFCRTGSRKPANEKEARLLQAAGPRMAEAERIELATPTGTIAALRFAPIGSYRQQQVLVVHGWGSRIAYLQELVTGLRQAGFTVIGLDLPGHGQSSGTSVNVAEAIIAIDRCWQQFGPFHAMVGHSFGGYNATMSAHGILDGTAPHQPDRLVIIASPNEAESMFADFCRMLGLSQRAAKGMDAAATAVTGKPVPAFDASKMLSELSVPTLVLHAEDDKEVPASAARAYANAGPHVTLTWMNGLGHRRIVNAAETIQKVVEFLV